MQISNWLTAATLMTSVALQAQTPPNLANMQRFNGTVESVNGKTLKVKSNEAGSIDVRLMPNTLIMVRQSATLQEIDANSFIGCTAVKQPSGEMFASECHLFPESMRGTGEGHNPMGPPATTMTNGTVATMTNGSVQSASGNPGGPLLKVAYKGGEQSIHITPKTELTKIVAGDAAILKPGVRVAGGARPAADGVADVIMLNVMQ